jgi:hypothetical protein
MEVLVSPSNLHLLAIAAAGWFFSLACFVGLHRPRRALRSAVRLQALSRPPNIVAIADLRARHDRIYRTRKSA